MKEKGARFHSLELSPRTGKVYNEVIRQARSPSHDQHHIDIVLTRIQELSQWCLNNNLPVNQESIWAAGCVHDLGRNDPSLHGEASIKTSIAQAQPILVDCGYDKEEIDEICEIVRQHDQPDLQPTTLEALILKEADFLAGFGAWGIYRTIAWGTESGRSTKEIITTLRESMPRRIASLRLPPSQEIAFREWPLVNLFLAQLETQKEFKEKDTYPGKYLILEGTSGTGKGTQAKLLQEYLIDNNIQATIVQEPSEFGRSMISQLKENARLSGREITSAERALVLAVDRISLTEQITEQLRSGNWVIGIRSFLSALAYQGETSLQMVEVLWLNRFVTRPNLVLLLEIEPGEALKRIQQRHETEGVPMGDYEELLKLERVSERFKQAIGMIPGLPVATISADLSITDVFTSVKQTIEQQELLEDKYARN